MEITKNILTEDKDIENVEWAYTAIEHLYNNKILNGKGFCLTHFGDLCEHAELHLSLKQKEDFFPPLFDDTSQLVLKMMNYD